MQKWYPDFRVIATNEKHDFVLGELGEKGDRVRVGWSATKDGDIIELELAEHDPNKWEVNFAVNDKNQRLEKRYSHAQAITILSKVERMLQSGIRDLDDKTLLLTNAIAGDNLADKREKLYKRFSFKETDYGRYAGGEGPFFLHTSVRAIKSKNRRNDAALLFPIGA